jgi:Icc-related predicted phosphoesterase
MKNVLRVPILFSVFACFGFACNKNETNKAIPKPIAKKPSIKKPAPKADPGPICVTPWTTKGSPVKFTAGGFDINQQGAQTTASSAKPDDKLVFGVIADIKENTAENQANLKLILAHFAKNNVEFIVVPGDLGDTQVQIEEVITQLTEAKLPILTVIGNREGRTAYAEAIKASQARYRGLIDLNQQRLVIMDNVAFISMPGYHNKIYIHARDGCHYTPEEVEASEAIAKAAEGKTRFLVSHGPPRQKGPNALDRTLEQANVGDPELQNFLMETGIPFGIFANIHEAGGRATNRTGEKRLAQNQWAESMYMNPGPADAVRWAMNDGSESVGMAAVVSVDGLRAKYSIYRLPTEEQTPTTAATATTTK